MNNNVIKSTDENAIERLEAKVAELKAYQAKMVATNKAIRLKDTAKGDAKLKELGYSEKLHCEVTDARLLRTRRLPLLLPAEQ